MNHCNDPYCRSPEEFCRTMKYLLSAEKIEDIAKKYGYPPLLGKSESDSA